MLYQCERCGRTGRSDIQPYGGTPNHPDGRCGLCDGFGVILSGSEEEIRNHILDELTRQAQESDMGYG